mgnify:FL=1
MPGEGRPHSYENRLRQLFQHLAPAPDLITLNSFFWDTRYFGLHAQHYGFPSARHSEFRVLTWGELAWHRTRLLDVVRAYRAAFPSPTTKLMFRLGQPHSTNMLDANIGTFQLNSSIRQAMKTLDVPIFECKTLAAIHAAGG